MRRPLILGEEPPGLPRQLSADLEQGFVQGGTAYRRTRGDAAPVRAVPHALAGARRTNRKTAAWDDPWVFRDLASAAPVRR